MKPLKVIDLFAGPGGLGEGFSAYRTPEGKQAFKIALSIEKEASAHRTLLLRALFRQYQMEMQEAYYAFLRGGRHRLKSSSTTYPGAGRLASARREAQAIELGVTDKNEVDQKVREALDGEDFLLIGGPPCQAYSLVS